jgi:hypothetical protein
MDAPRGCCIAAKAATAIDHLRFVEVSLSLGNQVSSRYGPASTFLRTLWSLLQSVHFKKFAYSSLYISVICSLSHDVTLIHDRIHPFRRLGFERLPGNHRRQ